MSGITRKDNLGSRGIQGGFCVQGAPEGPLQSRFVVGDLALGEVPYTGEFDALVALREPVLLTLRGGWKIGGVGQPTTEQERDLDSRQGLLIELRLLLDVGWGARTISVAVAVVGDDDGDKLRVVPGRFRAFHLGSGELPFGRPCGP